MVGRLEIESGDNSRRSISNEIMTQFRTRFLDAVLQDTLMDTSEATARTATLYARIILEDLVACGADASANPLLQIYIQFLIDQFNVDAARQEADGSGDHEIEQRRLPVELMHRMDSLSSSLSIATMDLFTSLLELQNDFVDATLLGGDAVARFQELRAPGARRRSSVAASAMLSPRSENGSVSPFSGAIWFACRFPESAVAANAHVWKIQAFDSLGIDTEIPSSAQSDSDTSEDQIVSLLSYIADAEFVTCQRAPAVVDDWDSSDEEDEVDMDTVGNGDRQSLPRSRSRTSSSVAGRARRDSDTASVTSRTAATRKSMKPLRSASLSMVIPSFSPVAPVDAQVLERLSVISDSAKNQAEDDQPTFVRLILNRLERILESSFYENLALSGLVSVLAQKDCCARLVFDVAEQLGAGASVRAVLEDVHMDALRRTNRLSNGGKRLTEIRHKLVDENNESSLNDHEPETRLLSGYVVLEEILKELCSILFAKERVRSLPVKPEGYYLEPKRDTPASTPRANEIDPTRNGSIKDDQAQLPMNIGQEFEQLIADAESTMGSFLSELESEQPIKG
ncbi:hypothetical protein PINS_up016706 [Pythium insidiosum]|nr:hypothetical protein PINS_up016706 [Pythium insidiosum]